MYIWKIVISYLGTKKTLKIRGKPSQSNVEVFRAAKDYAIKLKKEDPESNMKIDLVSGTKAYPPNKDTKLGKYENWCPYCMKPRVFYNDNNLGVKRCPVCKISESDFYFKKYNGIFDNEKYEYIKSLKAKEKL